MNGLFFANPSQATLGLARERNKQRHGGGEAVDNTWVCRTESTEKKQTTNQLSKQVEKRLRRATAGCVPQQERKRDRDRQKETERDTERGRHKEIE